LNKRLFQEIKRELFDVSAFLRVIFGDISNIFILVIIISYLEMVVNADGGPNEKSR